MNTIKGAVYLQGSCFYTQAFRMWETNGYEVVEDVDLADIVCWLGGADINPSIYGEKPNGTHQWNARQDDSDLAMVETAGNRFKVGICRGAQLLNCVPNGGRLWQNVDAHQGQHPVTDVITGKPYWTNSIHHQALRLTDKAELVAYTSMSKLKQSETEVWRKQVGNRVEKDVEAAWYADTRSLLVQWHPELGNSGVSKSETYFMELMERYYDAA